LDTLCVSLTQAPHCFHDQTLVDCKKATLHCGWNIKSCRGPIGEQKLAGQEAHVSTGKRDDEKIM